MKFKKLMSLSTLCLVGVLGIGLLTGCNNDDEENVLSDDTTTDETDTGPASGLVFDNLFGMLGGFTFEGSIDIAYGDTNVGLEFTNCQAVIPLDISTYSWEGDKLAIGGDVKIVYDSYSIDLGITYLDSAVYVDYGEDSYWSEGEGNAVHFYMENSDIGDLISLFSSEDEAASSVDWGTLLGLDLDSFQPIDLAYGLSDMNLTTDKNGGLAFAYPLSPLGISDSLLIRTNENSECTGLECTNLELGEFTISMDLSLAAKSGLKVATPVEQALYADLSGVNSLIPAIYDIIEYKYYSLSGTISLDLGAYGFVRGAEIPTTLTMRIGEDGQFTMLIDCDIPIVIGNFLIMDVGITDGSKLINKTFHEAYAGIFGIGGYDAYWSDDCGAQSRHTTVYYDSEDDNIYFHRTDIGEGHKYTDNSTADTSNSALMVLDDTSGATANDYSISESYNTYEQWGMLSSSKFGNSAFAYILDNMIGCGEMITSALESDGEDSGMEFTIPKDFNGLITNLETSTDSDGNWTIDLGVSAGPLLGGSLAMLDKANVSVTLDKDGVCSNVAASVPIEVDYNGIAAEFTIGLDFDVQDGTGKTIPSGYEHGGTSDPFKVFEDYIAAHTCKCEDCDCEEGECDCECDSCTDGCKCYFIQDQIVERLWLDETRNCSCGCDGCILGQCTCQSLGVCTCNENGCSCTTPTCSCGCENCECAEGECACECSEECGCDGECACDDDCDCSCED